MIFTNQRSYISQAIQHTQSSPNVQNQTPFSLLRSMRVIRNNPNPSDNSTVMNTMVSPPPRLPPPPEKKPKKMSWGEPTWNLFHVLAEKVKEEEFASIRVELLDILYTICSNLPCPDCANHASMYLNDIRYKNIQTKEQLKNMLFQFHNTVNKKKDFPQFPREALEDKYSKYDLIPVLQVFMVKFEDKHKSIRMIADDFHRSKIAIRLKKWFNNHISNFVL